MRLVVIIPTLGRRELMTKCLKHLESQSRPPDEVIVSAPDENHVENYAPHTFEISWVFGRRGGCAQRNGAIDHGAGRFDIMTFFDDDFLPAASYLSRVEAAFQDNPGWVLIRGEAVHDGAHGPGFTFDEGVELLQAAERRDAELYANGPEVADHVGGYGCNMSVRAGAMGDVRFDERLPLYGWQEDIDFSCQLRRHGRIVGMNTLYGVHLGIKSGRTSGLRFGYSQVANPVYLARKGTVPRSFIYKLMLRNIAANFVKSVAPESYIDRRGRLRGNLLAAFHVLRGKVDPEHILKL